MPENECKNSYVVIKRKQSLNQLWGVCYNFHVFCIIFVLFSLSYANSVDPDQTPHGVALDRVLHGLLMFCL